MTDTLISLISVFIGILGGLSFGFLFKNYSSGVIGNTIAGVFGSILLIKVFGRLGFNPQAIMQSGSANVLLFIINMLVSFFGGAMAVFLSHKLKTKFNK